MIIITSPEQEKLYEALANILIRVISIQGYTPNRELIPLFTVRRLLSRISHYMVIGSSEFDLVALESVRKRRRELKQLLQFIKNE